MHVVYICLHLYIPNQILKEALYVLLPFVFTNNLQPIHSAGASCMYIYDIKAKTSKAMEWRDIHRIEDTNWHEVISVVPIQHN